MINEKNKLIILVSWWVKLWGGRFVVVKAL